MTTTKNNNTWKVLSAILAIALVALSLYTYNFYNNERQEKALLERQKQTIESDLDELVRQYDEEIERTDILNSELYNAREEIITLREEMKGKDASIASLATYRKKYELVQKERDQLLTRIDILEEEKAVVMAQRDSTVNELNLRVAQLDSVSVFNQQLSETVKVASTLVPTNLITEGVIVRRSGKQIPNERAWRVDEVRTCFTLPKNELATTGNRSYYIQIINPEGNVVNSQGEINFDQKVLNYSKKIEFSYDGTELDICELVVAEKEERPKGLYVVHLFDGPELLATSNFSLR